MPTPNTHPITVDQVENLTNSTLIDNNSQCVEALPTEKSPDSSFHISINVCQEDIPYRSPNAYYNQREISSSSSSEVHDKHKHVIPSLLIHEESKTIVDIMAPSEPSFFLQDQEPIDLLKRFNDLLGHEWLIYDWAAKKSFERNPKSLDTILQLKGNDDENDNNKGKNNDTTNNDNNTLEENQNELSLETFENLKLYFQPKKRLRFLERTQIKYHNQPLRQACRNILVNRFTKHFFHTVILFHLIALLAMTIPNIFDTYGYDINNKNIHMPFLSTFHSTTYSWIFLGIFIFYTFYSFMNIIAYGLIFSVDRNYTVFFQIKEILRHVIKFIASFFSSTPSFLKRPTSQSHRTTSYLNSKWGQLDFIAILSYWISFGLQANDVENRYGINFFRSLTALPLLRVLTVPSKTAMVILRSFRATQLWRISLLMILFMYVLNSEFPRFHDIFF